MCFSPPASLMFLVLTACWPAVALCAMVATIALLEPAMEGGVMLLQPLGSSMPRATSYPPATRASHSPPAAAAVASAAASAAHLTVAEWSSND